MRSKKWLEIWEKKGSCKNEEQHVIDGWDLNSEEEYRKIAYSCLRGSEHILSQPNLKMVELGCGAGAFISALKSKFPDAQIEGADYSHSLIKAAQTKTNGVHFSVLDMNSSLSQWQKTLSSKTYDVIFSFGTFLYLSSEDEVVQVLHKMNSMLSQGGLIILGEINDSELKKESSAIREEALKDRKEKSSNEEVDHLYISRELFKNFTTKAGLELKFLSLPSWYPASRYRYHVVIRKR